MLFSSLSESGFIPTNISAVVKAIAVATVLISFREWLHSYHHSHSVRVTFTLPSSHLFQRVASFLHLVKQIDVSLRRLGFSSLSESGFIPTFAEEAWSLF